MGSLLTWRSLGWTGFFGLVLCAWVALFAMNMDAGLNLLGRPMSMGVAEMGAHAHAHAHGAAGWGLGVVFSMWALMVAAMMLPTMVPALSVYDDLIRGADGTRAGWFGVIAGYGLAWLGAAALLGLAQVWLSSLGVVSDLGASRSGWLNAALLGGAGVYQFTRVKAHCHDKCRSPLAFYLGAWRPGLAGGGVMGLRMGLYCIGCCWPIMALAFVGGVMNLIWMGIATLFMVIEKLPDLGRFVYRPAGVALVAAAVYTAASAASFA